MRLIDADELIKQLQKERASGFPANENLSFYAMSSVNHAPTAYSIDKVVQEAEASGYNKAIDDFQAWFKTQIVGIDYITKEILVVEDDKWLLAIDKFKKQLKEGVKNE